LFRYSALTFNGHRIHYDQPYATGTEGYPGLVVHGPLLATLLADLALNEGGREPPARFAFRALKPVFDRHVFTLAGRSGSGEDDRLWVADHQGALALEASFTPSA
jgi:3-methylfumaryl-CoA hydratase